MFRQRLLFRQRAGSKLKGHARHPEIRKIRCYYEHGVSAIPLSGITVGNPLRETAARIPENEALVASYQTARLTRRYLDERANEAAAGLLALGLEPGDRVGVCAPNLVERIVL